jgi:ribosomal protein L11 methylase PrmA
VQGPIAALRAEGFALVVANLLRSEVLPLVGAIARATLPDGRAVFSGLLEAERDEVERALARVGLHVQGERRAGDPGGERWLSLVTAR